MSDQIAQIIRELADQLHTTVEYLWPVLVRYTFFDSLVGMLYGVFWSVIDVAVVAVLLKLCWRKYAHERALNRIPEIFEYGLFSSAVCVAGLLVLVLSTWMIFTNLVGVLSPEGAALIRLLGKVH
jgi:hypothetical protein